MSARRITLAALAALTLGPMLAAPASAQYYRDDYGYDRPRRPPPPDYGYDRPRYRDRYDDGYGRRGGGICGPPRGNCRTRPGPFNAPCECEVPGFGIKRGQIGG